MGLPTSTADLQWNRVSSLETISPEVESLLLGHLGLNIPLEVLRVSNLPPYIGAKLVFQLRCSKVALSNRRHHISHYHEFLTDGPGKIC
ncbi:hypothetical protein AVEN_54125-1 [Araneus ventricosus]|uniref:Uncharacterized protein n=1 Tax=Araneus ventricosus TaxID=182803 RepID=A0A4Y2BUB8_ARAVE|nr:hypothetical protein AVEN_54125-1 [Araneus ventricosus]